MSQEIGEKKKQSQKKSQEKKFSDLNEEMESNTKKLISESQKIRADVRSVLDKPPTAKLLCRELKEPKI